MGQEYDPLLDEECMQELAEELREQIGGLGFMISDMAAEVEKIVRSLSAFITDSVEEMLRQLNEGIDEDVMREHRKYERRVEYHRRLSERNRLHPKRKPRR